MIALLTKKETRFEKFQKAIGFKKESPSDRLMAKASDEFVGGFANVIGMALASTLISIVNSRLSEKKA